MKYGSININSSEPKDQIIDKVNFNFGQIVSFSSGPIGRPGPVGPTGYPGAAGRTGLTGATGQAPSLWVYSVNEPDPAEYKNFDFWISLSDDTQGFIYFNYSGSWNYTGLNIFDKSLFSIKSNLQVFTGSSSYSGIYLPGNTATNQNLRTFVISDSDVSAANANKNYSKVLISTTNDDKKQILSFRNLKSSGVQPSFYWSYGSTSGTPSSSKIKLVSDYNLGINSGGIFYMRSTPGTTGSNLTVSANNISISTFDSDVYFNIGTYAEPPTFYNRLILSGSNLEVRSADLFIDDKNFEYGRNFKNIYSSYNIIQPADNLKQPEGAIVSRGGTSNFPLLWIGNYGSSGSHSFNNTTLMRETFTVRQASVNIDDYENDTRYEGVRGAIVFGSTGGAYGVNWGNGTPTGPTGPWAYHVEGNSFATGPYATIAGPTSGNIYYIDATNPGLWKNQVIVLSANSIWPGTGSVWIKIPGTNLSSVPPQSTYYPFWSETHCCEQRIVLDETRFSKNGVNSRITGIFWDQLYGNGSSVQTKTVYQKFIDKTGAYSTKHIEITYFYTASDKNVKAMVSTPQGEAYYLKISDYIGS